MGIKLAAGFIALLLMLVLFAHYAAVMGMDALAENVGIASEAIAESLAESMDTILYMKGHELVTFMANSQIVAVVMDSNSEFDAMEDPQAYIDQVDEEWTSTPLDEIPETMEAILGSNLSLLLTSGLVDHYKTEHGLDLFTEVAVTNSYGAVVATTNRIPDFRQDDEAWWQSALQGELLLTDIVRDESAGSYGVMACVPVADDAGDVVGVAKALINVLSIAKDIELTELGYDTSELKITTADGRLVFSSRAFVMLEDVSLDGFFLGAVDIRGHFSEREGGADRLFSYAVSDGYHEYPGYGWIMFLSHAEDEVLGAANELQLRMVAIAVFVTVFGAVISLVLARSITRPIRVLDTAAQDMARGKLDTRVVVSGEDELGRLAASFNEMASELDVMYSDLDRKVKERTEDLENVNKRLGMLASITRHDALNQITIQKGWLGMAMESAKDPSVNEYLRKVETTTNNLISFIKFTSEYEEVGVNEPEWLSLKAALDSAITGLELKGAKLTSELDGVEVFADPMFPKVLHNLIGNSLKHGQTVTAVSLSYQEGPDGLTIVMEDNGVGIPAERKEAIFQRASEIGKSTHGLFISAEILRITRISIRETGIAGEGARFEIFVPRGGFRFARESPSMTRPPDR